MTPNESAPDDDWLVPVSAVLLSMLAGYLLGTFPLNERQRANIAETLDRVCDATNHDV